MDLKVLANVEDHATIFTVDGEDYEIHDFRYFSDADEIRFNQMTTRERRLTKRCAALQTAIEKTDENDMPMLTDDVFEAKQVEISNVQEQILALRKDFICMTTTCPPEVVDKIKSYDKTRVIAAVIELSNKRMGNAEVKPEAEPDEGSTFQEDAS